MNTSIKSQIISGSVLPYIAKRKDKSSATSSDLTVCCQCSSFEESPIRFYIVFNILLFSKDNFHPVFLHKQLQSIQLHFSKNLTASAVQHKLLIGATVLEILNFLCFLTIVCNVILTLSIHIWQRCFVIGLEIMQSPAGNYTS